MTRAIHGERPVWFDQAAQGALRRADCQPSADAGRSDDGEGGAQLEDQPDGGEHPLGSEVVEDASALTSPVIGRKDVTTMIGQVWGVAQSSVDADRQRRAVSSEALRRGPISSRG